MCTLGIKTDGMITEFVNTKLNAPEQAVSPTAEGRGKHEPWNKVDRGAIKEHINSYHPTVSHYKVSHVPLRRYLEPGLTISLMSQDFCEKQKRISYELYRQVFESENITFGEPSHVTMNAMSRSRVKMMIMTPIHVRNVLMAMNIR